MNKDSKISELVRQNCNSLKLTSEVVEALTGKKLEWFIEALGEALGEKGGEENAAENKGTPSDSNG